MVPDQNSPYIQLLCFKINVHLIKIFSEKNLCTKDMTDNNNNEKQ